jgi:hypothetical protein
MNLWIKKKSKMATTKVLTAVAATALITFLLDDDGGKRAGTDDPNEVEFGEAVGFGPGNG